jgi:hypothetical protein
MDGAARNLRGPGDLLALTVHTVAEPRPLSREADPQKTMDLLHRRRPAARNMNVMASSAGGLVLVAGLAVGS